MTTIVRWSLLTHCHWSRPKPPPAAVIASLLPHLSKPTSITLSLLFQPSNSKSISSKAPKPKQPHLTTTSPAHLFIAPLKPDGRVSNDCSKLRPDEDCSATIAAVVTPTGGPPGAVGIVRLSGSSAVDIVGRVFRRKVRRKNGSSGSWRPTSHVVEYGDVVDSGGNVVDEVLVVPMLAPRSYTREDVVELQCHGSEVCLNRVLRACLDAGARLAEPGEFTLRAFLNGRLDLSQAENIGKLISAKSVAAADAALAGIQGGFSSLVKSVRMQCIELLTEIEARLDFDDEMPPLDVELVVNRINSMSQEVEHALETANYDKLLQSGLQKLSTSAICLHPQKAVDISESVGHLFLRCSYASIVWNKVLQEFGVGWCMPSSCAQLFLSHLEGGERVTRLWQCTVLATFWAIWLERNSRTFDDSSSSVDNLWDKIRFWVATWVYRTKEFEGVFFLDLRREWVHLWS